MPKCDFNKVALNMKIVHIRSFLGSYFPRVGLITEIYRVNLCIQSKCRKIQTRRAPNTDTYCAVIYFVYVTVKHFEEG